MVPKPGDIWIGPGNGSVRIIAADKESVTYYSDAYRATHSAPTAKFIKAYRRYK